MGWGDKVWYDVAENTLSSWIEPLTRTFSKGLIPGMGILTNNSWHFLKTHPLLLLTTATLGTGLIIAYRYRGIGIGFGKIHVNAENFLGHFEVKAGLGHQEETDLSALSRNLRSIRTLLETHQDTTFSQAKAHHRSNLESFQTLFKTITTHNKQSQGKLDSLSIMSNTIQGGVETLVKHRRTKSESALRPK